jgi:tetratricopeptide repeat protein 8
MEDEGVAELLLDNNAISQLPPVGTSLSRPHTGMNTSTASQGIRPVSASGRPITGFARPGTGGQRPGSGVTVESAFQGNRPGTARPVTSSGRYVRLGTASMLTQPGGPFINLDKLDFRKYAARPALAKVLCDYIFYYEHNPRKALELAALATIQADYKDWFWKARLGKAYYQLGLYRDAEKQFKSSLKDQEMVSTYLELTKVYLRLDQPNTALDILEQGNEKNPHETHLLIGIARIYDLLNDSAKGVEYYKKVLKCDSSNVEAIACLSAHQFYSEQPEIGLRYFRRLLQIGVNNTELWNNLGLCCFYASQYDMTLSCFERALALADDNNMADCWYNIGQVAVGIGDLGLAYQAFKISVSIDSNHAESFNNLGVLELKKGNIEQARSSFQMATGLNPNMFEAYFNGALLSFKLGDFQESYELAKKTLNCFPEHSESQELLKQLRQHFTML